MRARRRERARAVFLAIMMVGSVFGATVTFSGAAAGAETISVPGDYSTIQKAENNAQPGDTIVVDSGEYSEKVVVDTPDLTFEGPNAGDDARDGHESPAKVGAVSEGGFAIQAANVTVDGFTLTLVDDAAPIRTSPDASGYVIKNNIIENNELGLELRSNGASQTVVKRNLISENDGGSVAKGINTGFSDGSAGLQNALITENKFVGHTEQSNSYSIQLIAGEGHSDVTISDNTMDSTILLNSVDTVTVDGNTVDMSTDTDSTSALYLGGSVTDASLTSNTLRNADRGLGVSTVFAGSNGEIDVTDNTFQNNGVQVKDTDDQALDMEQVATENTFDQAVTVDRPSSSLLHTVWSSVQDGVEAAESGDTVSVQAGTYTGRVQIATDITLQGTGDVTLTADSSDVAANQRPTLQVAADATVTNLTVIRRVTSLDPADDKHTKAIGITREKDGDSTEATIRDVTAHLIDETGSDDFGNAVWISNNNAKNGKRYQLDVTLDNVDSVNEGVSGDFGGSAIAVYAVDKNIAVTVSDSTLHDSQKGLYLITDAGASIDSSVTDTTFQNNQVQIRDVAESLDMSQAVTENSFDRAVTVDRPSNSLLHTVWSSVQDGVNEAQSGDTVRVRSGTYSESVTVTTDNLTLEAADGASPTIVGDGNNVGSQPHAAIYVDGNGPTTNVTIEGFTVRNPNGHYGIFAGTGGSNSDVDGLVVRGNTIEDVATNLDAHSPLTGAVAGLYVRAEWDTLTVEDNTVRDVDSTGEKWRNAAGLSFSSFIGNEAFEDADGLVGRSGTDTSSETAENTVVRGNDISNITGAAASRTKGISFSGEFDGLTVENNTVTGIDETGDSGNALGITLTENPPKPGTDIDGDGTDERIGPRNFEIRGNEIDSLSGGDEALLFVGGYENLGSDHVVAENKFLDVGAGVDRYAQDQPGFNPGDEDLLNATENWWGAVSGPSGEGPGSGSEVGTHVEFEPFYVGAALQTLSSAVGSSTVGEDGTATVDLGADSDDIETVEVSVGDSGTASSVTVVESDGPTGDAPEPSEDQAESVATYVDIAADRDVDQSVTITLTVERTALGVDDVRRAVLLHFVDDEWVKLDTEPTVTADGAVRLQATPDALSPFAVAVEPADTDDGDGGDGGGGGGGGGGAVLAGTDSVSQAVRTGPIQRATTTFARTTTGTVSVRAVDGLPSGAPAPTGTVIAAVDISPPDDVADRPGTVELTVSRAALDEAGVQPSDLRIVRFDEGAGDLDRLETDVTSTTGQTVVVTADTPGFSVFAVVADQPARQTATATPAPTDTPTEAATDTPAETATDTPTEAATDTPAETPTPTEGGGPGFGAVIAVVALLAAAGAALRSRD